MNGKIRAAIIGGSEDGKTALAAGISRGLWACHGFRTVAFDPYRGETNWGPQALVIGPTKEQVRAQGGEIITREFERFRRIAQGLEPRQKIAVIWDEGTDTGGRDRDNTGLFTAIRHSTDVFIFIGHGYSTMLPTMRGSLNTVLLAVRDSKEAADWAQLMTDDGVLESTRLKQYEFLHKRKHQPHSILRPTLDDLQKGIRL